MMQAESFALGVFSVLFFAVTAETHSPSPRFLSLTRCVYAATQAKNSSTKMSDDYCDPYRAYWDFQPSDTQSGASLNSGFSCGWPSWQSGVRLAACIVALIAAAHFAVAVWRSSAAPSVCLCVHASPLFQLAPRSLFV
jgi:hypothetical protein